MPKGSRSKNYILSKLSWERGKTLEKINKSGQKCFSEISRFKGGG